MKRRGQIKIQQMSFMLIAVFIFFILVGLFVLTFRFSGLRRSAAALEEKESLLLVTKLANSPEFSCGDVFGSGMSNCIDFDKVIVLKDLSDKYSDFWDISNIIIRKATQGDTECNKGNYLNCDYIDVFSRGAIGFPIENFVTLCKKESDGSRVYDNCEVGKLIIYYNEEQ